MIHPILHKKQFNYVTSNSIPVEGSQVYSTLAQSNIPITKSGYLYVFVSNESSNVAVYFDNLNITHTKGALLEETHYYAYGLEIKGISSRAQGLAQNKIKYNGKEQQTELDLNWLDYGARQMDAQLGLWHNIDPKAEASRRWTPYNYCYNNPIMFVDPDGMLPTSSNGVTTFTGADAFMFITALQYGLQNGGEDVQIDYWFLEPGGGSMSELTNFEVYDFSGVESEYTFRSDKSILFSNETDAYKYMDNRVKANDGIEVLSFMFENTILVLPDKKNTRGEAFIKEYGYNLTKGKLYDPITKKSNKIWASIHTHHLLLKKSEDSPSHEDIATYGSFSKGIPFLIMFSSENNRTLGAFIGYGKDPKDGNYTWDDISKYLFKTNENLPIDTLIKNYDLRKQIKNLFKL